MTKSNNNRGHDVYQEQRQQMVTTQLKRRGINNQAVLEAFIEVPRHRFVPERLQEKAYEDRPLPIGNDQTISQPYIVAEMIQALEPAKEDKMLEIGTGSGYASAILSQIISKVHSVERFEKLAQEARERFAELGYDNIKVHIADGTTGWSKAAPYQGILVSAAAPEIPQVLVDQLADDGKLVIPVGDKTVQKLYQVKNDPDRGFIKESLGSVRFVPLIGEEGWKF